MWGYQVAQGLVFAIEEINRNSHLLPNLTLGFSIWNSGDSVSGALYEAMKFLTGREESIPNYMCQASPPRAAVVGEVRSTVSIPLTRLLGLYKSPQVSYASSLNSLSDKTQFPSFLWTVTSDLTGSHMVVQLVLNFSWFWVDILAQDDDYGLQGSALVAPELTWAGVCIECYLHIPSQESPEKTSAIIRKMEGCTAQVVLVFLSNSNFGLIVQGLLGSGVLGRVWVSKGALHGVQVLPALGVPRLLHSSFSFLPHHSQVPDFLEFLAHMHPNRTPEDIIRPESTASPMLCTTWMPVRVVTRCVQTLNTFSPGRRVHFKAPNGREVAFDANGDAVTEFDILQGQKTPEGSFHVVRVGTISQQASSRDRVAIYWTQEELQTTWEVGTVPSSFCSLSCAPGFSQIPLQGAPHCCLECRPCPEVTNQTGHFRDVPSVSPADMKQCLPCLREYSSHSRDHCLPRTETFLAFGEPLGLTLTSAALTLASLTLLVMVLFLKHQDIPVVRANNRDLSYILLTSLAFYALCPLLFLGRPTTSTCLLHQTTFATVSTVAVSSVLTKTSTVILAFRVTRPGSRAQVVSSLLVLAASLGQVILRGVWLGISPPFLDTDVTSESSHIVVRCHEGSGAASFFVLGCLGLLAAGTFLVAFLARGLPDVFNETKFLSLVFSSIWVAFLPLYHSARDKSTVAVEIFSILASTTGLLCGIFAPECYIILLRPERNVSVRLRRGRHQARGAEDGAPE
ncbi:LOW QUALITY PROTEIN: vomeronasal type-2 receptor 26-like [Rhynchocyon petersi]